MNSFEFMNSCVLCKMGKINGIYKNIGLENIFKNILWGNDKTINFFDGFLYFPRKLLRNFSKIVY